MKIKMAGIDHSKAAIEYRELFSFTKKSAAIAMEEIKNISGICGCILLSTCNRMELWVSYNDNFSGSLYEILCKLKHLDPDLYHVFFTERSGMEAIHHLFLLASGLESKILGEDQIITQVKDSLSLSRENYCTDNVLEVLFRNAITAAKKVKTSVTLSIGSHSVVENAVSALEKRKIPIAGKTCMVIGNGEMGKLSAAALKERGAKVTVTIRQYKSGQVSIPKGCQRINYGDRYSLLPYCDIIISATASPNCTLKYEDVKLCRYKKPVIFIDLAVPRDIDPRIADLENITFYNIDSFGIDPLDDDARKQMELAEKILLQQENEFISWYECKDYIPGIQKICSSSADDLLGRLEKPIKHLDIAEDEKTAFEETIKSASKKNIYKLLFELRDHLDHNTWLSCIRSMEHIYH